MSTSLLYHAFGVRGYRYVRTDYFEGELAFTIEQPRESCRCSVCRSPNVIRHGESLGDGRYMAHSSGGQWKKFGIADWKRFHESDGDLSVVGIVNNATAVPNFEELVAAVRKDRVKVILLQADRTRLHFLKTKCV